MSEKYIAAFIVSATLTSGAYVILSAHRTKKGAEQNAVAIAADQGFQNLVRTSVIVTEIVHTK